jgi:phage shock protein C
MAVNLKGLRRIPERGVVAGVCAGIAEYFDWNTKILRVIAVVLLFCGAGFTVVVYLALWYIMDPITPAELGQPPASGPGSGPSPGRAPTSMHDIRARFAKLDERLRNIEECVTDKEFELRQELKKLEA